MNPITMCRFPSVSIAHSNLNWFAMSYFCNHVMNMLPNLLHDCRNMMLSHIPLNMLLCVYLSLYVYIVFATYIKYYVLCLSPYTYTYIYIYVLLVDCLLCLLCCAKLFRTIIFLQSWSGNVSCISLCFSLSVSCISLSIMEMSLSMSLSLYPSLYTKLGNICHI